MIRPTLAILALATLATAQNVLLLQADDLGTDLVGCYGGPSAAPTPNLDALAARGVRFSRCYANPTCSPTRAAILTGQYAFRCGIGRAIGASSPWGLDPRPATLLPKALPAGYLKVAIGKWHLGTPETGGEWHPVLCGFDLYAGSLGNFSEQVGGTPTFWNYPKTYASPSGTVTVPWTGYATEDEASDAILALQVLRASGRPWFLYVNFHAVHKPWHYPPGYSGQPSFAGGPECRAMAEYLDMQIGRILAAVDISTTSVLFTADNGSVEGVAPASALRGGKHDVYEGGIRVPMIAAGQGIPARGAVCGELVQSVDLYATVLELAGAAVPVASDSISFAPVLAGRAGARSWAFCERFNPNGSPSPSLVLEAVLDARHKLVLGAAAAPEFFDLVADPGEQNPLPIAGLTIAERASYDALLARANALGH